MKSIPASPEVRALRQKAHESFDRIWRNGHMDRWVAYLWLAERLGTREKHAHIGQITDIGRLNQVILFSDEYMGTTAAADDFPDDL